MSEEEVKVTAEYPGCNGHRIKKKCALANGRAHPGKPPKKESK